ncbi:hypothetical protein ABEW50_24430 [Paenibacillus jamilae]
MVIQKSKPFRSFIVLASHMGSQRNKSVPNQVSAVRANAPIGL